MADQYDSETSYQTHTVETINPADAANSGDSDSEDLAHPADGTNSVDETSSAEPAGSYGSAETGPAETGQSVNADGSPSAHGLGAGDLAGGDHWANAAEPGSSAEDAESIGSDAGAESAASASPYQREFAGPADPDDVIVVESATAIHSDVVADPDGEAAGDGLGDSGLAGSDLSSNDLGANDLGTNDLGTDDLVGADDLATADDLAGADSLAGADNLPGEDTLAPVLADGTTAVTGVAGRNALDSAASAARWHEILAGFVDDPRGSVEAAASQVENDIATSIEVLGQQQEALRGAWPGEPDTEALRAALQRYRTFGGRLAEVIGMFA